VAEDARDGFVAWGADLMPPWWHAAQDAAAPLPRPEHAPQAPGLRPWLRAWWTRRADDGPPLFLHS
jgi:hypothetical protein